MAASWCWSFPLRLAHLYTLHNSSLQLGADNLSHLVCVPGSSPLIQSAPVTAAELPACGPLSSGRPAFQLSQPMDFLSKSKART